jgi:hypothetical protein
MVGVANPAPALLGHCKEVYAKMLASAKEDKDGNRYWEGALTRLVTECGLSNPYYSSVTRALKQMDCVRQGRRGGGGMGSVWFLLQEPTDELFSTFVPRDDKEAKGNAVMDQTLSVLNQRLGQLEDRVAVLEARS